MAESKKIASTNTEATDPNKFVDKIGKELYERNADDSNLKNRKERIFFNGSSYSGADIKVLVHKYHEGPTNILADLDKAIQAYKVIAQEIGRLSVSVFNIADAKQLYRQERAAATNQEELLAAREKYDQFIKDIFFKPIEKIESIENAVKQTGHYQHVSKNLRGVFVEVQQINTQNNINPLSRIKRFQLTLESLVERWEGERDAIRVMSEDGRFFQTKTLAELQTISISTYRDKSPVRSLGRSNVKGYTRGQRTVAGSMIFTVFDRNVLFGLLDFDPSDFDADNKFRAAILDQLPPIDITIQFANEYGSLSRMTIYGVEFVSEGQSMSIEDLLLENVVQWVARDIDPMTPIVDQEGRPFSETLSSYSQALYIHRRPDRPLTATDLIGSTWGENDIEVDASVERFKNRRNPFF